MMTFSVMYLRVYDKTRFSVSSFRNVLSFASLHFKYYYYYYYNYYYWWI